MKTGLLIRRIHLYAALFLMPWVLMYAVSGIFMHHRELVRKLFGQDMFAVDRLEREIEYTAVFPENADTMIKAEQILSDLGLTGRFNANENKNNGTLIIHRNQMLIPHRVEYNPADKSLKVFAGKAYPIPVVNRLHHRLGYGNGGFLSNFWAVFVDLVILAIFYWSISGVVMWLGIKPARRLGLAFTAAGAVVFFACVLFI